jgi:pimeloyl-ACP methyl ester carboxylesterase
MLASAATFFGVELGTFERYLPTDDELDAIAVPVEVLVSERGRVPLHGAARRLAARLGVPVTSTPGTHTAYGDHPLELAETLRRFLRQLGRAAWPSGR